jgi:hypothetical protein
MKFSNTIKKINNFCKVSTTLLLLISFSAVLHSQPISAISETRHILIQKIDSLDLEKQLLKRQGQPVTEIENRQKEIIDSLNSIRKIIQTATTERISVVSKSPPENKFLFFKPQGYFDWLILIIASIAGISGLILLIGIIKTLSVKKNKKTSRTGLQAAQTYSQVKQFRHPEQPSNETAISENPDSLNSLRRRVAEEQRIENETIPPLHSESPPASSEKSTDIKSLVFKAASEGLDVQEISRRLHLSADQVSLILKVMNKTRPK